MICSSASILVVYLPNFENLVSLKFVWATSLLFATWHCMLKSEIQLAKMSFATQSIYTENKWMGLFGSNTQQKVCWKEKNI